MKTLIKRYKIKLVEFKHSAFNKQGTKTALVRQRLLYKSVHNNETIESNEYRVAFITVPVDETLVNMRKQLTKNSNCCIYKVLSNHPILSPIQEDVIKKGWKTLDDYADKQVVRFNIGEYNAQGKLVLDFNSKPQYRTANFSLQFKEDIDIRTSDPNDYYASPVIRFELESISE
jgi:hypothetical protein